MGYKLLVSDLDGTFFNKKGEISQENYDAVKTMYERGIHFVPTSGRSYGEMPKALKENPYIRYYIGSGGGTIYDKKNDITHSLFIPNEISRLVLDKFFEYPVSIMLHADNTSYVDADMHNAAVYKAHNYTDHWVNFVLETNIAVHNFKEFTYTKNVEMFCTFFKNYTELLECKERFAAHPELLVAQSNPNNLEVVWKNAGKGNAALKLAEMLGIDKGEIIAVGDSTNDLTMIQAAGLGLAMENAVDELKKAADKIICSNEEHSAKYILENFIK